MTQSGSVRSSVPSTNKPSLLRSRLMTAGFQTDTIPEISHPANEPRNTSKPVPMFIYFLSGIREGSVYICVLLFSEDDFVPVILVIHLLRFSGTVLFVTWPSMPYYPCVKCSISSCENPGRSLAYAPSSLTFHGCLAISSSLRSLMGVNHV